MDHYQEKIQAVRQHVGQVIVGKEEELDLLLTALFSKGHVLLEDVPGTGKTMLAKTLALVLGCSFKRLQFTPDLLPADILGIQFYDQKTGEFQFRSGPVFTQILLGDEINRATPRTQSSLLESMEERQVSVEGETRKLPNPFFVIATQNPVESQGTFSLPEAQLDRFLMKLKLGYPDMEQERVILQRFKTEQPQEKLEAVLSAADILAIQSEIKAIHMAEDVETYLLEIIQHTRNHEQVEVGVSPRGSLALMRACQSYAYIQGRDFITPDDIRQLVPHVLGHRIILNLEAQLKASEESVLNEILESVSIPMERV